MFSILKAGESWRKIQIERCPPSPQNYAKRKEYKPSHCVTLTVMLDIDVTQSPSLCHARTCNLCLPSEI